MSLPLLDPPIHFHAHTKVGFVCYPFFTPIYFIVFEAKKVQAVTGKHWQYVDILCKDLGINSRRKSNLIAEIFSPYKPEDFSGFVDEYFANNAKGANKVDNDDASARGFQLFKLGLVIITILFVLVRLFLK